MVRHGETISNCKGLYCGWQDDPLTEVGIAQAEEAREKLKNIQLDRILSSDLQRTRKTAEIINQYHHLEVESFKELREMHFGSWEGMNYEKIQTLYPKELRQWETDWFKYAAPQGESLQQMYERVVSSIEEMLFQKNQSRVLMVLHAGCIRGILAYFIGRGPEDYWRYKIEHGKLCRIEFVDRYPVLTALNQ